MRRLGPPVGRDATELARSAICRAGPLTSRGTRPPIVHDRIQDHHHPRTTTTKCGGSIAQHDRVPSTGRLNGDVPDARPHVCVCAATLLRHTGRGALVAFSFLPPALLEKTGTIAVTRKLRRVGEEVRACRGRAWSIRYFDATTCPRVARSDVVGARFLSNLQGPTQDDEGEERGEGAGGGASSIWFKPARAGSLTWLSLGLGRLWVLAKTIARL